MRHVLRLRASRVDVLIHFLVKDEPRLSGWQSDFLTRIGAIKPSFYSGSPCSTAYVGFSSRWT